jgi:large subunit ribosomal protein L29
MQAKELRDLDDAELAKQVAALRSDLFGLRFANATGELDDTARLGRVKRDLARALTVTRQRELQAERGDGR